VLVGLQIPLGLLKSLVCLNVVTKCEIKKLKNYLKPKMINRAIITTLLILINSVVFSHPTKVTVSGTIKIELREPGLPTKFCFYYKPIYSEKNVIIPIITDTLGNFNTSFYIEQTQEVIFSSSYFIGNNAVYSEGLSLFSFFARPGQTMKINIIKDQVWNKKFSGDFSVENNEYQLFSKAYSDENFDSLFFSNQEKWKNRYDILKPALLRNLLKERTFLNEYFKKHNSSTFVRTEAKYCSEYSTFNHLLNLYGLKINDALIADFSNATGIPVSNISAEGNNSYMDFIQSYYFIKESSIKTDGVDFSGISSFVANNYSIVPAKDSIILSKISGGQFPTEAEIKQVREYMSSFGEIATMKSYLNYFLSLNNLYLKELFSTIYLLKLSSSREIIYASNEINRFNKETKRKEFKELISDAYNKKLLQIKSSKVSAKSIINTTEEFGDKNPISPIIKKYQGKVLYIDIWATWCAPCIAEMKNARALREKFKETDVKFIYICISSPNKSRWLDLIAENKIEGENYFLSIEQSDAINKALRLKGLPHHIIVDKTGKIINDEAPAADKSETERLLKQVL